MAGRRRKATFALDRSVLQALDEAVAAGAASSKNALVEQALRAQLKALRHEMEWLRWQEAARDPLFMKDIARIEGEFEHADAESARLAD